MYCVAAVVASVAHAAVSADVATVSADIATVSDVVVVSVIDVDDADCSDLLIAADVCCCICCLVSSAADTNVASVVDAAITDNDDGCVLMIPADVIINWSAVEMLWHISWWRFQDANDVIKGLCVVILEQVIAL